MLKTLTYFLKFLKSDLFIRKPELQQGRDRDAGLSSTDLLHGWPQLLGMNHVESRCNEQMRLAVTISQKNLDLNNELNDCIRLIKKKGRFTVNGS